MMIGKSKRLILVIFCLVAFGGMQSCRQTQTPIEATIAAPPQETPTAAATSPQPATPTASPTPSAAEIHTAIVNALLALQTQPNRMEVTTVLGDGQTSQNIIEFIPPHRKRILSPAENVEYVVIGDKVYVSTSGVWEETSIPASTFLGEGAASAQSIGDTIREPQLVRRDQLEGKDVLVLSYSSTALASGIELTSQAELWLGAEDGLPYKMVMDGETLAASTDPATGESKLQAVKALTTTIIFFDPAIEIEPPEQ